MEKIEQTIDVLKLFYGIEGDYRFVQTLANNVLILQKACNEVTEYKLRKKMIKLQGFVVMGDGAVCPIRTDSYFGLNKFKIETDDEGNEILKQSLIRVGTCEGLGGETILNGMDIEQSIEDYNKTVDDLEDSIISLYIK